MRIKISLTMKSLNIIPIMEKGIKENTHTNMKVGEGEKPWQNKTRTTYMVGYH
jgi:hypothetical protein